MFTLFDQEQISKIHDHRIAKEERLANLKMIMKSFGVSASQALDALGIAEEERPAYLELLGGQA